MSNSRLNTLLGRFAVDYGMLAVLLLLGAFFSVATYSEQHPAGADGGRRLAGQIAGRFDAGARCLVLTGDTDEDAEFVAALAAGVERTGVEVVDSVQGKPADARKAIERLCAEGKGLDVVACNRQAADWPFIEDFDAAFPTLAGAEIVSPESYWWPNFLESKNLVNNIASNIAVIAIIAIGMTMVIITAGIDLSVGSLIALSAVVATLLIRDVAGSYQATAVGMALCCMAAVLLCGGVGAFSGAMVTFCRIPPFIVTLAMMMVASGLAFIIAKGQSIYEVPGTFIWLGRGNVYFGWTAAWALEPIGLGHFADKMVVPHAVLLMVGLYVAAHVLMTRTTLGRYIYAVGGNREAARLSGVPVQRVLLFVYAMCGMLAGLGGVVMASRLKSGAPTYGVMYELYVIAAVVVGGTSLAGGEGKIFGTLIGAFIIAVIQNGMNLTGVESYTQKVVLGLVILGAVLLDMLKKRGWEMLRRRS